MLWGNSFFRHVWNAYLQDGRFSTQKSVEPPSPGQEPRLYFSKLPGSTMSFEECKDYLAALVSEVVGLDSIVRVDVTEPRFADGK